MAKAMEALDVVEILMNQGYIVEEQDVAKPAKYTVQRESKGRFERAGYITSTLFEKLCKKGIIEFSELQVEDKNGVIYNFYHICIPIR